MKYVSKIIQCYTWTTENKMLYTHLFGHTQKMDLCIKFWKIYTVYLKAAMYIAYIPVIQ